MNERAVPADLVTVARVIGAYGIKGWLKLDPFSRDADALHGAEEWWLRRAAGSVDCFHCITSRPQGSTVVAQLAEIADRDLAETFKGAEVLISRADFPNTDEDEYYWVDLIGCAVESSTAVPIGQVSDMIENAAHAILRVKPDQSIDRQDDELIPFVGVYIKSVDLAARKIVVNWPPER